MKSRESYLEFVSSESYKHHLDVWYRAYNVSHEKTELFYDFLISLYDLIEDTFLGEDVLYSEVEQRNHFTWCWNKTIENFEKEKIYFKERGNCYEYFWNFYLEAFYYNKLEEKTEMINEYFYKLFSFYEKILNNVLNNNLPRFLHPSG